MNEKVSLYFCQGSSDKEYHASLEEKGDLYTVSFTYGRRGSTLQAGTKTQSPVPYKKAKKIYDALVKEKLSKGYTPGKSGTPYQATDNEKRATGILPQLLNPIEESEVAALIDDDAYWMQEKKDGKRILIKKDGGRVVGINRKGLEVSLPEPIVKAAEILIGKMVHFILDGECCGDTYFVFDMLEYSGDLIRERFKDMRGMGYGERLRTLEDCVNPVTFIHDNLRTILTARAKAEKTAAFKRLKREQREGVVFKRHDAPYTAGRPNSGGSQLKFKFYATASCLVAQQNAKRSVALELWDGGGELVGVGNVTIPPNKEIPQQGQRVEIRYLYAIPHGSLYQPVYLGVRDDVEQSECTIKQLKYRAKDDEDEA